MEAGLALCHPVLVQICETTYYLPTSCGWLCMQERGTRQFFHAPIPLRLWFSVNRSRGILSVRIVLALRNSDGLLSPIRKCRACNSFKENSIEKDSHLSIACRSYLFCAVSPGFGAGLFTRFDRVTRQRWPGHD